MTKLQKKLARQNAATERALTYGTSNKVKNTTRRVHSKGNLWNHNNEKITKDTTVEYTINTKNYK